MAEDNVVEVGTDTVVLRLGATGATAVVHRHGAHVTSFKTGTAAAAADAAAAAGGAGAGAEAAGATELLYTSPTAILGNPAKAIRGGIPICWPQFGPTAPALSPRAAAATPGAAAAADGGVVVSEAPLRQHGFARTSRWAVESTSTAAAAAAAAASGSSSSSSSTGGGAGGGGVQVVLRLRSRSRAGDGGGGSDSGRSNDDEESGGGVPAEADAWGGRVYTARYTVAVLPGAGPGCEELHTTLHIVNDAPPLVSADAPPPPPPPVVFTGAMHTYLAVADLAATRVEKLGGGAFRTLDNATGAEVTVQSGGSGDDDDDAITFPGEVDVTVLDTPDEVLVRGAVPGGRVLRVAKNAALPDSVVWNPGADKAKAMADLPDDGYKNFICVESAVTAKPVELWPGEEWTGTCSVNVMP